MQTGYRQRCAHQAAVTSGPHPELGEAAKVALQHPCELVVHRIDLPLHGPLEAKRPEEELGEPVQGASQALGLDLEVVVGILCGEWSG